MLQTFNPIFWWNSIEFWYIYICAVKKFINDNKTIYELVAADTYKYICFLLIKENKKNIFKKILRTAFR